MLPQAPQRLASALLLSALARDARRFRAQLAAPENTQRDLLRRLLLANADTRFGEAYGFGRMRSVRDFQAAVPVMTYEHLEPWLALMARAEPRVLTAEPVLMFERSGGSSGGAKYIPYTARLRSEFHRATAPWLYDLYTRFPALQRLGAYWSVSPAARAPETTPGGIPIGFEDDAAYFGGLEGWMLRSLLRTPPGLHRVGPMSLNRYVTLRCLLDRDDVGLISVWNPSFLTLLVEAASRDADRLCFDLTHGTLTPPVPISPALHAAVARTLRPRPDVAARLREQPITGSTLFPRLQLISCWTDAMAARALPALSAQFPGVPIQGKGLLATEGVVSLPLMGYPGAVLAIGSHFLEFMPCSGGPPCLAHELEPGETYEVVITTGGGFYRYALRDQVRMVGRAGATPTVVFIGKTDLVSDLVGEKLNERHVAGAMAAVLASAGLEAAFSMLSPEEGRPPAYLWWLATPVDAGIRVRLASALEARLRENPHYAYARDLGQLGPLAVCPVGPEAPGRYLEGCMALGQRAGDVKPVALHRLPGWGARLGAGREVPS